LTVKVFQWKEILSFTLTYSTALFKEETIDMFSDYFRKLLEQIPQAPGKKLTEMTVLSQTEKVEAMADVYDDLEAE
ncbi:MAG: hypothetical protein GY940_37220, partial [bacterium]|nr:hypothetical protein [bacterium]